MKKLLVPTDFSANADKALDFAVQIARQAKAEIYLIHACELIDNSFKDHLALKKEHNDRMVDRAGKNLARLRNSIEDAGQVTVHTKIYTGGVTDCILQASEVNEADIIIIGTRGETKFTDRIFGSTTSDLMGKSKVPVMVVSPLTKWDTTVSLPGETTRGEAGGFKPDAILFATNHFEENTELLNPIINVAKLFSSTVHVSVFVDTDFAQAYDYIYNVRELNRYISFLKRTYCDVAFKGELLEGKDLESTLEKYNDEKGVDIIAMITYPKSFWERLMKKSVTKKMAFHSRTPVLAIPAK